MITPSVWKSPFVANAVTANTQEAGVQAAAPDGSFFTVWGDPTGAKLSGRKFNASGTALTGDVGLVGGGPDSFSDAVVTPDGRLRIAFVENGDTFIANYDANLTFNGFTFVESSATNSRNVAITRFSDGSRFVTYTFENSASDWDILGNFISSAGVVSAPVTIFNDTDKSDNSRLATLDNGNIVIVYQSEFVGSTSDHDVFFQIRSQTGGLVKGSTGIRGGTSGFNDVGVDVAALHTGGFVAVWTTGAAGSTDIHAVIYDKDGNVVRSSGASDGFTVNTTTAGNQNEAHVTSMDDGGFLVTWEDDTAGNQKAQRFDSSGNKIGQEIVTFSQTVGFSSVDTLADGRTVVSFDRGGDIFSEIFDTRTNVTGHATGHDLFGDGSADQLILRTSSANNMPGGLLTMFDLSPSGGLTQIGQVGADWTVAGSGDLNGDGRDDIVMQHDVGTIREIYSFTMGATQVVGITKIGQVGLDWQIDGSGDFNGDGFKDILVERVNAGVKELTVLGVTSGTTTSVTLAGALTPSSYQVDGIGDMNGDGVADILVHYDDATGRHFVGLNMGNYTTQSVTSVANIGAEWNAVGMGDFNGDGRADILITTDTANARDIGILINQGGSFVFKDLGPIVGKNVQIDGIGDFNGDGTADISFHDDPSGFARTNAYFEMNDSSVVAIHTTGSTGHEWVVT